jgi:hypothetical protein
VHSSRRGSRDIERIGSAHDDVELELLKALARQKLTPWQGVLDLGLDAGRAVADRLLLDGCLVDALSRGYWVLGLAAATGGDEAFRQLVRADHRTAQQAGFAGGAGGGGRDAGSVTDRDAAAARLRGRLLAGSKISAACAAHAGLGAASLVLYDCSTVYLQTDQRDGFSQSGFSKEPGWSRT